ncbi:MAG: Hpt domain-containing protein, partial [Pirellulales bacterium]
MVQESHITVLRDLLQKIGLELAFISTGGDEGKNNLHHLLQRFLTNLPQDIPAELCSILQNALEKTAENIPLTEDLINYFNIWHPWLEEALSSLSHALPLPTIPSALMTEVNKAELNPDPEENQSVTVLPDGADQELMRLFCAESEELLQDIEQGVLRLEKDPNDTDTLATVFRAFHTFKGNAAVMKLVVLQKLAHELESLLDSARRGDYQLDRNAIDAILLGADIFSKYVLEASQQLEGKNVGAALMLPIPTVVNRIRSAFAVKNKPLAHPLPEPQPTTLSSPKETVVVEQITDLTPNTQQNAEKQPSSGEVSSPPTPPPNIKHLTSQSIRVDTQKLDGLVDLVGELVIAQSLVSRGAESHGSDEHLSRSLSQLRGITSDLHRTAMALRMIPIRNTFQKMSRVVRDLSDQLG